MKKRQGKGIKAFLSKTWKQVKSKFKRPILPHTPAVQNVAPGWEQTPPNTYKDQIFIGGNPNTRTYYGRSGENAWGPYNLEGYGNTGYQPTSLKDLHEGPNHSLQFAYEAHKKNGIFDKLNKAAIKKGFGKGISTPVRKAGKRKHKSCGNRCKR